MAVPESMIVPPVPFFRVNSDSGTGSLVDPTVMPFSERSIVAPSKCSTSFGTSGFACDGAEKQV
uniref:Uncharacterized protein n=1 Tax=Oryza nivara TaxID=4536 RepID=A0A0E0GLM3_ORYNI